MSIIWGAVSLDGRPITKEQQDILKAPALKCNIDRVSEISGDGIYMGCALQYVTPESHGEVLPVHDEHSDTWFDADIMLDNRSETGRALGLAPETTAKLPDGELVFRFVKEYEDNRLNDLLGAYVFAYYDARRRRFILVDDAVGNRCVYYRIIGKTLYYSTFIEALRPLYKCTVNGNWISYFLGDDTLGVFSELHETPVMEIRRPAPGGYIVFDDSGVHEKQYWTPMSDFKELRLKNDDEYREAFQELMSEAVTCVLRSDKETGIALSGGYDSNTVNAYAAPFLEKHGKKLHSFTIIPEKGLATEDDGRKGAQDESGYVRKTAQIFKNLECSFLDMSDISIWKENNELLDYFGLPLKSVYSMIWFHNAYRKAHENGINLMLTGEYGNLSISFGDYNMYINDLFNRHRYIKMLKEAKAFCNKNHYSFKHFVEAYFYGKLNPPKKLEVELNNKFLLDNAPGKDYAYDVLMSRAHEDALTFEKYHSMRKKISQMIILRQISDLSSLNGSHLGVMTRDPSRDKRIIEWCLGLPVEQFTKNGETRRLIKEYMKGIVPDYILNIKNKGVQGSDAKARIMKEWDMIRRDGLEIIDQSADNKWIDLNKLTDALKGSTDELDTFDLFGVLYTVLLLKQINKITGM